MLALALALGLTVFPHLSGPRFTFPVWTAVAAGYCLVGLRATSLHLQLRRESFTTMVTEIPLVIGFFVLPPAAQVAACALGGIGTAVVDRVAPYRAFFNTSCKITTATAAVIVFRAITPAVNIHLLATWFAAYLAVVTAAVVSVVAVAVVLRVVQGKVIWRSLPIAFFASVTSGLVSATFALVTALAMSVTRWALAPMIVVAAAFVLLYLAYTRKVHEHKSLGDLYDATAAIGIARHDGTFAEELVSRVRRLLRAESATLWLPSQGREPELLIAAHEDREGVDYLSPTRPDPARAIVVRTARTYLIAPRKIDEPVIREKLAGRGVTDAILTPLRSGDAIIGCLEVANRLGRAATFTRSDARLLETIAAHAGVAAENDRLIRRLSWDAYHDVLTGLANRWRFLQALEDEIAADVPPGEIVAVLLLDLDSFKDVNDTLGHAAGDQLLNEVGQRLKQIAPGGALVARLGGDEFALLVRAKGSGVIQEEAEALQRALEQPFEWDGVTLDVGGSIGIAVYPDHGTDASTLLQRADVAMYAAKGRGRGIALYVPTMDSSSVRRLSLAADLRRAIEDGQLQVYFQPKVALTDQQLIGVEALVRWEHPEHGTVTPDDFVPIAEHTGQYLPLTRLVLNTSLAQCRTWLDQNRELTVAVNVSVRCLSDPHFADEVSATLRAHRVPASMLTLEITESGVMSEIERVLPTLTKLREHGIGLSVDDFGTGYSSLAYLRRLPVTEVKIDKSFVLAMGTDPADLAIVKAILELGRHLDLTVVAEGVESEISMSLLAEMACDVAQGFLLARPLPVDRLERWIERRTVMESETAGKVRRLRVVGA